MNDECVQGEDALLQNLIIYINTPKDEYEIYQNTSFGNEQAKTIFTEKNLVEYKRQCERIISKIMTKEHYKSYIEQIYSVERKNNNLYIELKLHGKGTTSTWLYQI